jgi:prepilin-type N-terminal cleavage/methylation domain-containing protein
MTIFPRNTQRGFTLIELLVVIAIIGILASIILVSLASARLQAFNARRFSDLKQFQNAFELYYSDHNAYPISYPNWSTQCAGWSGPGGDVLATALVPKYITAEPTDPQMNAASNQNCYLYKSDPTGSNYKIMDYNLIGVNVSSVSVTFIDPMDNSAYWNGSSVCATPRAALSWAIWTSSTSQCY